MKGLRHASRADGETWDEFNSNWERLAFESEEALRRITGRDDEIIETLTSVLEPQTGPTETITQTRTRLVQGFFRKAVLASYDYRCAISGLTVPELISASHIIPWSQDVERRADPRNGIALSALHHQAFDRGFISIDESLKVVVSKRLHIDDPPLIHRYALLEIEGKEIILPSRFAPDPVALEYHREHIFE